MSKIDKERIKEELKDFRRMIVNPEPAEFILSGWVVAGGITILAVAGWCVLESNSPFNIKEPDTKTAIIKQNGNAMIVELNSYKTFVNENLKVHNYEPEEEVLWSLETVDGDQIYVPINEVVIIDGQNSYLKAAEYAMGMVDEDGWVVKYNNIKNQKTRKIG